MSDEQPDAFSSLDSPSDTVENLQEQRRELIDALVEAHGCRQLVWCDFNAGSHQGWVHADEPVPQAGDRVLVADSDPGFIWRFAEVRRVVDVRPMTYGAGSIVDMGVVRFGQALSEHEKEVLRRFGIDHTETETAGPEPLRDYEEAGRDQLESVIADSVEDFARGEGQADPLAARQLSHATSDPGPSPWIDEVLRQLEHAASDLHRPEVLRDHYDVAHTVITAIDHAAWVLEELRLEAAPPTSRERDAEVMDDMRQVGIELADEAMSDERPRRRKPLPDWVHDAEAELPPDDVVRDTVSRQQEEIERLTERDRIWARRVQRLQTRAARAAQIIADHGIPLDTVDDGDDGE